MDSSSALNPQRQSGERRDLLQAYVVRSPREKVLEAMLRVAAAEGYAGTTVAAVVERAGVSQEDFDQMFESKEACFLAAYDAAIDVLVANVLVGFEADPDKPWPERAARAMRALVETLASEADIVQMAMVEVTAAGEGGRGRERAALARFTPFFEEGRAYASRAETLPADTASFAIGAISSMISDEVRSGRGAELERILPDLTFAFLMPYLGAEEAEKEAKRSSGKESGD